jgi:hypothetical protein
MSGTPAARTKTVDTTPKHKYSKKPSSCALEVRRQNHQREQQDDRVGVDGGEALLRGQCPYRDHQHRA